MFAVVVVVMEVEQHYRKRKHRLPSWEEQENRRQRQIHVRKLVVIQERMDVVNQEPKVAVAAYAAVDEERALAFDVPFLDTDPDISWQQHSEDSSFEPCLVALFRDVACIAAACVVVVHHQDHQRACQYWDQWDTVHIVELLLQEEVPHQTRE
jgi:hypothetical protein